VANPLATMDADCVDGTLVWADGRVETPGPGMSKATFARWLVDRVLPAAAARAGR
jgi:hypothetical protein